MLLGSSVRYVLDEGDYRENSQEAVAVIQAKKKKKSTGGRILEAGSVERQMQKSLGKYDLRGPDGPRLTSSMETGRAANQSNA